MKLLELKQFFEQQPNGKMFSFGLSYPFSWRGSYDEVAFSIDKGDFSREKILENINEAYTQEFDGYKGGTYKYNDWTTVNFEEGYGEYTNGSYLINKLFEFIFN